MDKIKSLPWSVSRLPSLDYDSQIELLQKKFSVQTIISVMIENHYEAIGGKKEDIEELKLRVSSYFNELADDWHDNGVSRYTLPPIYEAILGIADEEGRRSPTLKAFLKKICGTPFPIVGDQEEKPEDLSQTCKRTIVNGDYDIPNDKGNVCPCLSKLRLHDYLNNAESCVPIPSSTSTEPDPEQDDNFTVFASCEARSEFKEKCKRERHTLEPVIRRNFQSEDEDEQPEDINQE